MEDGGIVSLGRTRRYRVRIPRTEVRVPPTDAATNEFYLPAGGEDGVPYQHQRSRYTSNLYTVYAVEIYERVSKAVPPGERVQEQEDLRYLHSVWRRYSEFHQLMTSIFVNKQNEKGDDVDSKVSKSTARPQIAGIANLQDGEVEELVRIFPPKKRLFSRSKSTVEQRQSGLAFWMNQVLDTLPTLPPPLKSFLGLPMNLTRDETSESSTSTYDPHSHLREMLYECSPPPLRCSAQLDPVYMYTPGSEASKASPGSPGLWRPRKWTIDSTRTDNSAKSASVPSPPASPSPVPLSSPTSRGPARKKIEFSSGHNRRRTIGAVGRTKRAGKYSHALSGDVIAHLASQRMQEKLLVDKQWQILSRKARQWRNDLNNFHRNDRNSIVASTDYSSTPPPRSCVEETVRRCPGTSALLAGLSPMSSATPEKNDSDNAIAGFSRRERLEMVEAIDNKHRALVTAWADKEAALKAVLKQKQRPLKVAARELEELLRVVRARTLPVSTDPKEVRYALTQANHLLRRRRKDGHWDLFVVERQDDLLAQHPQCFELQEGRWWYQESSEARVQLGAAQDEGVGAKIHYLASNSPAPEIKTTAEAHTSSSPALSSSSDTDVPPPPPPLDIDTPPPPPSESPSPIATPTPTPESSPTGIGKRGKRFREMYSVEHSDADNSKASSMATTSNNTGSMTASSEALKHSKTYECMDIVAAIEADVEKRTTTSVSESLAAGANSGKASSYDPWIWDTGLMDACARDAVQTILDEKRESKNKPSGYLRKRNANGLSLRSKWRWFYVHDGSLFYEKTAKPGGRSRGTSSKGRETQLHQYGSSESSGNRSGSQTESVEVGRIKHVRVRQLKKRGHKCFQISSPVPNGRGTTKKFNVQAPSVEDANEWLRYFEQNGACRAPLKSNSLSERDKRAQTEGIMSPRQHSYRWVLLAGQPVHNCVRFTNEKIARESSGTLSSDIAGDSKLLVAVMGSETGRQEVLSPPISWPRFAQVSRQLAVATNRRLESVTHMHSFEEAAENIEALVVATEQARYVHPVSRLKDSLLRHFRQIQGELKKQMARLPPPNASDCNPDDPCWGPEFKSIRAFSALLSTAFVVGGEVSLSKEELDGQAEAYEKNFFAREPPSFDSSLPLPRDTSTYDDPSGPGDQRSHAHAIDDPHSAVTHTPVKPMGLAAPMEPFAGTYTDLLQSIEHRLRFALTCGPGGAWVPLPEVWQGCVKRCASMVPLVASRDVLMEFMQAVATLAQEHAWEKTLLNREVSTPIVMRCYAIPLAKHLQTADESGTVVFRELPSPYQASAVALESSTSEEFRFVSDVPSLDFNEQSLQSCVIRVCCRSRAIVRPLPPEQPGGPARVSKPVVERRFSVFLRR